MAKHIGYYNDPQDIKELVNDDAKSIVKHYKKGMGAFFPSTDPDDASVKGCRPVMVGKQKWYVKKSINKRDLESEDNFIDIFRA